MAQVTALAKTVSFLSLSHSFILYLLNSTKILLHTLILALSTLAIFNVLFISSFRYFLDYTDDVMAVPFSL